MYCKICDSEEHDMSAHYGEMGEADPMMHDPYSNPIQSVEEFGPGEQGTVESHQMPPMTQEAYVDNLQDSITQIPAGVQQKAQGVASDIMTLAQAASSGDAEVILGAVEQFSKSQLVRFLDITFIGPFLLLLAWKGRIGPFQRLLLGAVGLGTVSYNARNYLKNKKILQPSQLAQLKQELLTSIEEGQDRPPVEKTIAGYYGR